MIRRRLARAGLPVLFFGMVMLINGCSSNKPLTFTLDESQRFVKAYNADVHKSVSDEEYLSTWSHKSEHTKLVNVMLKEYADTYRDAGFDIHSSLAWFIKSSHEDPDFVKRFGPHSAGHNFDESWSIYAAEVDQMQIWLAIEIMSHDTNANVDLPLSRQEIAEVTKLMPVFNQIRKLWP